MNKNRLLVFVLMIVLCMSQGLQAEEQELLKAFTHLSTRGILRIREIVRPEMIIASPLLREGTQSNPHRFPKGFLHTFTSPTLEMPALSINVGTVLKIPLMLPGRAILTFGLVWRTPNGSAFPPKVEMVFRQGETKIPLFTYIFKENDRNKVLRFSIDISSLAGKTGSFYVVSTGRKKHKIDWLQPVVLLKRRKGISVILISLDTLRADHLPIYGYQRMTAPTLSRIARESVVFTHAFSTTSWTLPAHISLFTGLPTFEHGVEHEKARLPREIETLTTYFARAGYYTVAFTGGGFLWSGYGFGRGFDEYHMQSKARVRYDGAEKMFVDIKNWFQSRKAEPFFLFIHTYQIHSPYANPHPRFLPEDGKQFIDIIRTIGGSRGLFRPLPQKVRKNIIDLYDSEIYYTDQALLRPLFRLLEKKRLDRKTVLVVFSDHGEEFFDHHGWSHGHALYPELTQIPLLIRFPSRSHAGKRIHALTNITDILPTVFDFLRIPYPKKMKKLSRYTCVTASACPQKSIISILRPNIITFHNPLRIAWITPYGYYLYNAPFQEHVDFSFEPPPPRFPLYDFIPLRKTEDSRITQRFMEQFKVLVETLRHEKKQRKGKTPDEIEEQLRALGYIQ